MGKEMQIHLKEKNGEGNITISIMLLRKITRKPQNISLFKLTMTPFRVECSAVSWMQNQVTKLCPTQSAGIFS